MRHTSLYSPEPAKGWLLWGAIAPFLCILLVALPNVGVFYLLKPFGFVDAKGDPIGVVGFCAYMLETFIAMSLVVLGWVRFVERRPIATIGLTGAHPMRTLLHGYAIGIATVSFVVAMIGITGGYHVSGILNAFHSPKALLGIVALLPCFIVQSSVEELIFRGWLLSTVARKFNVTLGVVLTTAVFTLLHYSRGQHWAATVSLALFSIFTCVWARRSGNIWGVMGWHAAWNWLMGVGFEIPITGMSTGLPALIVKLVPRGSVLQTGGAQGPEGSVWCSVFFAVGIGFILLRPLPPHQSSPAAAPS